MKIMIITFSIVTLILIILSISYFFSLKRIYMETLKDLEILTPERKEMWKEDRFYVLTYLWRRSR